MYVPVILKEQYDMFSMVASVLHLGNVTFEENDSDASQIPDMSPVDVVAVGYVLIIFRLFTCLSVYNKKGV